MEQIWMLNRTLWRTSACFLAAHLITACGNAGQSNSAKAWISVNNFEYTFLIPKHLKNCPASSGGNVHGYVLYPSSDNEECLARQTHDTHRYISLYADFNSVNQTGKELTAEQCEGFKFYKDISPNNSEKSEYIYLTGLKHPWCVKKNGNRIEAVSVIGISRKEKSVFSIRTESIPEIYVVARVASTDQSLLDDTKLFANTIESMRYK